VGLRAGEQTVVRSTRKVALVSGNVKDGSLDGYVDLSGITSCTITSSAAVQSYSSHSVIAPAA
jgi:hypothetical protein